MLVPTDVTNQIIPPKEDRKRNFKCHVPKVQKIARKCAARIGGVWNTHFWRDITQFLNLVLRDAEGPGTYFRSAFMVFRDPTGKSSHDNVSAQALWNEMVYADSIDVRANRIDARIE